MSWRHLVDAAQDVMLDTFAERDGEDLLTTEIDDGTSGPTEVRAIFEDGWLEVLGANLVPISTRLIRVDCAIDELPSYPLAISRSSFTIRRPREGDPLESTASVTFRIVDQQPDGQGLVRFVLQAVRP